jgi:hypothetical protein
MIENRVLAADGSRRDAVLAGVAGIWLKQSHDLTDSRVRAEVEIDMRRGKWATS